MADSSITVNTNVAAATFVDAIAEYLWAAQDKDQITRRLLRWKDFVDEYIKEQQENTSGLSVGTWVTGDGTGNAIQLFSKADASLTLLGFYVGGTTETSGAKRILHGADESLTIDNYSGTWDNLVTFDTGVTFGVDVTPAATQSVSSRLTHTLLFSDLGTGVTDEIAIAIPTDEILVGLGITINSAFTSGSGNTTGLQIEVGINTTDVDRAGEAVDVLGATGAVTIPAGVGLGEVTGSGTWEILVTALGGGSENLDDIDAGSLTITVLTHPL